MPDPGASGVLIQPCPLSADQPLLWHEAENGISPGPELTIPGLDLAGVHRFQSAT